MLVILIGSMKRKDRYAALNALFKLSTIAPCQHFKPHNAKYRKKHHISLLLRFVLWHVIDLYIGVQVIDDLRTSLAPFVNINFKFSYVLTMLLV